MIEADFGLLHPSSVKKPGSDTVSQSVHEMQIAGFVNIILV